MSAVSFEDQVQQIAIAITRQGSFEKSSVAAHATLIAAAEVIAACDGPIASAEACYNLADFFACMRVER